MACTSERYPAGSPRSEDGCESCMFILRPSYCPLRSEWFWPPAMALAALLAMTSAVLMAMIPAVFLAMAPTVFPAVMAMVLAIFPAILQPC